MTLLSSYLHDPAHTVTEIPPSQANNLQEEKPGNRSAWLSTVQLGEFLKVFPITLNFFHAEIILYLYINMLMSCGGSFTGKPHE